METKPTIDGNSYVGKSTIDGEFNELLPNITIMDHISLSKTDNYKAYELLQKEILSSKR